MSKTPNGNAGGEFSAAPCSAIGELVVWEEEGGFCTPAIRLKTADGEIAIDEMVEKLIPGIIMSGGAKGVIVEVTMRIVSPNDKSSDRESGTRSGKDVTN